MSDLLCFQIIPSTPTGNAGECYIFVKPDSVMHVFISLVFDVGIKIAHKEELSPREEMIKFLWPHLEQLLAYDHSDSNNARPTSMYLALPERFHDFIKYSTLLSPFRPAIRKNCTQFNMPNPNEYGRPANYWGDCMTPEEQKASTTILVIRPAWVFGSDKEGLAEWEEIPDTPVTNKETAALHTYSLKRQHEKINTPLNTSDSPLCIFSAIDEPCKRVRPSPVQST
jgi:hypothetical protein